MPFNISFVSLLKKPSTMFSQEPCAGLLNRNAPLKKLVFLCFLECLKNILTSQGGRFDPYDFHTPDR